MSALREYAAVRTSTGWAVEVRLADVRFQFHPRYPSEAQAEAMVTRFREREALVREGFRAQLDGVTR